jgi:chromosome partitioning protein
MPVVVAFVSQKGGVGKSTLARALATFAARSNLKTKLADLDLQQKTVIVWEHARGRHAVKPALDVEAFPDVQQAVQSAKSSDLLIIDTPGQIVDGTTEIARQSHLTLQPTSPSSDDLHLSVLVFLALERVGIPRERLAFALCGVLSVNEERDARSYLASFGYEVLEGSIPEHLVYREAMRVGRSITETRQKTLDGRAERLMADLLQKVMTNAGRKKRVTRG